MKFYYLLHVIIAVASKVRTSKKASRVAAWLQPFYIIHSTYKISTAIPKYYVSVNFTSNIITFQNAPMNLLVNYSIER